MLLVNLCYFFGIINLQLHEEHYVYQTPPITKFPPHIPLQSLSISVVRFYRITTCLLCVVQPSLCSPTLHMLIIMPPFFPPPCLSLPSHPSSPVPFPLVTVSPFLGSVSLLLFHSFSFCFVLILHR